MESPTPPTVLLLDDHELFRAGLRTLLEGEGLQVVADAAGTARCAEVIARTRPDVICFDVTFSAVSSADLVAAISERFPNIALLALTTSLDDLDIAGALRAGADGYVLKGAPLSQIVEAIRTVASGGGYLSAEATARVIGFLRTGSAPRSIRHGDLSDREVEVLHLIAGGLDNNQIAAELNISAKTVKNHISSVLAKLGLQNRVQAAVYAVRTGLA